MRAYAAVPWLPRAPTAPDDLGTVPNHTAAPATSMAPESLSSLSPTAPIADPLDNHVDSPPGCAGAPPATVLARRLDWAQLLRRVFAVDVTRCPRCPGRLRVIAFITSPPLVATILAHLGLPTVPPSVAPARGPPQTDFGDDFDAWS